MPMDDSQWSEGTTEFFKVACINYELGIIKSEWVWNYPEA